MVEASSTIHVFLRCPNSPTPSHPLPWNTLSLTSFFLCPGLEPCKATLIYSSSQRFRFCASRTVQAFPQMLLALIFFKKWFTWFISCGVDPREQPAAGQKPLAAPVLAAWFPGDCTGLPHMACREQSNRRDAGGPCPVDWFSGDIGQPHTTPR